MILTKIKYFPKFRKKFKILKNTLILLKTLLKNIILLETGHVKILANALYDMQM